MAVKRITTSLGLILLLVILEASQIESGPPVVSVFTGITGSNVYLVTNGIRYLLVEAGGIEDTPAVISFLSDNNVSNLDLIFITHGHPDHYGGSGQLAAQFPNAVIGVGSSNVKTELIANAVTSDITDYNFTQNLQVIVESSVLAALNLQIIDNFLPGESDYAAALFNRAGNYIFGGDILYVDSHMYLGPSVDVANLKNWLEINLPSYATGGSVGLNDQSIIYPGHGFVANNSFIPINQNYLNYFINTLYTCVSGEFPSLTAVSNDLLKEFPTYIFSYVTTFIPINTLWLEAQSNYGTCSILNPYYFAYDYVPRHEHHHHGDAAAVFTSSSFLLFLSSFVLLI